MQENFQFAVNASAKLDQHIADVLMGKVGTVELSATGRSLLHILTWHKGASHAKPLSELCERLEVTDRALKALVKELVEQFRVPIGARRQEPWGYFLCVSAEDFEIARRPYVHEILSLSRRLRALEPDGRLSEILGQLQLQLQQEEKVV